VTNPTVDGTVSTLPVTLGADIDDADLPGDEVDVRILVNGAVVDTQTITSAQTVSTQVSSLSGGANTWTVNATDSFGQSVVKQYNVNVPTNVTVYNQSAPEQLIDDRQATFTFFRQNSDEVYERTATDGSINLTGLPVGDPYEVRVSADGYTTAELYLPNLVDQQEIYLLPENATTSRIIFRLDDQTGRFPAESTTLYVERALNKSGDTRFRIVQSGQFDATAELPATLETGERYRLRVRNADGDTRVLGSYTPSGDAVAVLPIGAISFQPDDAQAVAFEASVVEENGQRAIRVAYRDSAEATTQLAVEVHRYGNESDIIVSNTTYSNTNDFTATYPIPAGEPEDATYVARFHADRLEADDTGGRRIIGDASDVATRLNMDPAILELLGYLSIVATTGLVVILDGRRLAPVTAVAVAGGLTAIGVVAIPSVALGFAGLAALGFAASGGVGA